MSSDSNHINTNIDILQHQTSTNTLDDSTIHENYQIVRKINKGRISKCFEIK